MIQFTQAPVFKSGDFLTASQQTVLADAFNSRLRSGLGDCTKRIIQYVFNEFRQLREPELNDIGEPLYPSNFEFHGYYAYLNQNDGEYPTEPPASDSGANIGCPVNQFVFGLQFDDYILGDDGLPILPGEGDRLSSHFDAFLPANATLYDYWQLAKSQRGLYDPNTNAQIAPAFDCAQSHMKMQFAPSSPHHKSYGSYQPIPATNGYCSDGLSTFPNLLFTFQLLDNSQPPIQFQGSCGPNYGGDIGDVAFNYDYPFAWYIYLFNGTVYRFPKNKYKQIKNGGGYLFKPDGGQTERILLNSFMNSCKGADSQRPDTGKFDIRSVAFDWERFFSSQYQLAPAYGIDQGDGSIKDAPPQFTFRGIQGNSIPSGTIGTPYKVHGSFIIGGYYIFGSKLTNDCTIEVFANEKVIDSIVLKKGDTSEDIHIFENGPTDNINFRVKDGATFDSSAGGITIECTELLAYYPEIFDGYMVARISMTKGDEVDNDPTGYLESNVLSDNYFSFGGIIIRSGAAAVIQQDTSISFNPVFQCARRFVQQNTRIVHWKDLKSQQPILIGYEVNADEKSVFYFEKNFFNPTIPIWTGLLNPDNETENGIITTAKDAGWTNEWLMGQINKPYRGEDEDMDNANASLWKASVYSDYFLMPNRCHVMAGIKELSKVSNPDLFYFINNSDIASADDSPYANFAPESLSVFNFAGDPPINTPRYDPDDPDQTLRLNARYFYKSCKVYPKDNEIEDIRVVPWNGRDVVRITLKQRIHHCDEFAPTTISSDINTWNLTALSAEPYRTDENAVRQMLARRYFTDTYFGNLKIGDAAVNSGIQFNTDIPWGSYAPTFYFVKLIPKPVLPAANPELDVDDNGNLIPGPKYPCVVKGKVSDKNSFMNSDRMLQMELYLRAMCEGFLDEATSISLGCTTDFDTMYEFSFENLCNQSFGKNYFSIIPNSARPGGDAANVLNRGYGQVANTVVYASKLNEFSTCINLLTKCRLPIPWQLKVHYYNYLGDEYRDSDIPYLFRCGERTRHVEFSATGPAPTQLIGESEGILFPTDPGMQVSSVFSAYCGDGENCCQGEQLRVATRISTVNYSFTLQDSEALNALDPDQSALLVSGRAGFFADVVRSTNTFTVEAIDGYPGDDCRTGETGFWKNEDNTKGLKITPHSTNELSCAFIVNGSLNPGIPPASDIAIGWEPGSDEGVAVQACNYQPSVTIGTQVKNSRDLILSVPVV